MTTLFLEVIIACCPQAASITLKGCGMVEKAKGTPDFPFRDKFCTIRKSRKAGS